MNTTTDKTTPRPWGYGYHRGLDEHLVGVTLENVAIIEDRHENAAENAALIVKAVNAHDELVEALRDIVSFLDEYGREGYCLVCCPPEPGEHIEGDCELLTARAALAKAEGA
jgi:hypothetical protein